MGRPAISLVGQRFGRLSVLCRDAEAPSGSSKSAKWLCMCDCGEVRSVWRIDLQKGHTTSCGCFQKEDVTRRNTTHGTYGTKHYWSWFGAEKRAKKFRATPPWADLEKVKEIYKRRPPGHHVDHIVPLNSPIVCGLHWEGNLQYLPASDNMSKKNKLLEQ